MSSTTNMEWSIYYHKKQVDLRKKDLSLESGFDDETSSQHEEEEFSNFNDQFYKKNSAITCTGYLI